MLAAPALQGGAAPAQLPCLAVPHAASAAVGHTSGTTPRAANPATAVAAPTSPLVVANRPRLIPACASDAEQQACSSSTASGVGPPPPATPFALPPRRRSFAALLLVAQCEEARMSAARPCTAAVRHSSRLAGRPASAPHGLPDKRRPRQRRRHTSAAPRLAAALAPRPVTLKPAMAEQPRRQPFDAVAAQLVAALLRGPPIAECAWAAGLCSSAGSLPPLSTQAGLARLTPPHLPLPRPFPCSPLAPLSPVLPERDRRELSAARRFLAGFP